VACKHFIGGAAVLGVFFGSTSRSAITCDVKSMQSVVPADTTITSAERLIKPVAHCKVDGYITTTDPAPGKVNFRVQLPDKNLWKNRFYFVGLGGIAGFVPTDSEIPRGNPLVQGFVVAGTDTGHSIQGVDYRILNDPGVAINFVHRGAHLSTLVAQQITKAYYDAPKFWRYHSGCSGGGRMGGEAAMRYPTDYDGILYGASRITLPDRIDASVWLRAVHAHQQMVREPGSWLSPEKLKMVDKNVTAACDATDGAIDGVVWDPRKCKYDVSRLRCESGDRPNCLTDPEIKSIKAILEGVRGPYGKLLFDPMPITNISTWTHLGATPPPYSKKFDMATQSIEYVLGSSMGQVFMGPDFDASKFDFQSKQALDRWIEGSRKTGMGDAHDLTPMFRTGGKIIAWTGASEPNVTTGSAMTDYVQFLADHYFPRGIEDVQSFLQAYTIPGMPHCGGGTGPADAPDLLMQILIDWVEQGKIPGPVIMHSADRAKRIFAEPLKPGESGGAVPNPTGPTRDFLVCPYPRVSVFKGGVANRDNLDVYSAANWYCKTSDQHAAN
jgi:feruloyl esterase